MIYVSTASVSFTLIFDKPTDPFMKSMAKAAETAIHTYVSPECKGYGAHSVAPAGSG